MAGRPARTTAASRAPRRSAGRELREPELLALQRTVGNHAAVRLIRAARPQTVSRMLINLGGTTQLNREPRRGEIARPAT